MPAPDELTADLIARMQAHPDKFKETRAVLGMWAERLRSVWIRAASKFKPAWWRAQYLGPGGSKIKVEIIGLNISVYRDDSGDKYNYEKVVEGGRGPYDMRQNVARSSKARVRKDGSKYLIIPMNAPAKSASFDIVKTGEKKDSSPALRNTYSYNKTGGGDKGTGRFIQKDRLGRSHGKGAKFIVLSSTSKGGDRNWTYPNIKGVDYQALVRDVLDKSQKQIMEDLARAIISDLEVIAGDRSR